MVGFNALSRSNKLRSDDGDMIEAETEIAPQVDQVILG